MKTLLTMLGAVGLISTSVAPMIINHSNKVVSNYATKTLYWNADHAAVTDKITSNVGGSGVNDPQSSDKLLTVKLGTSKDFKHLRFMTNNRAITWIQWGNDYYNNWFASMDIELNEQNNKKIEQVGGAGFNHFVSIKVVDMEETSFLAKVHFKLNLGYTWYQENGLYYFQLLARHYVNGSNTFSNATSHLQLTEGLILN